MKAEELKIEIYADGADIDGMMEMYKRPYIKGFTTNPSLMKKAGVKSYTDFVKEAVKNISNMPISFEVFADDFEGMAKEAKIISEYGKNIFVKIPITDSRGKSSVPLIKNLSNEGIQLNITAVFTMSQIKDVLSAVKPGTKNILSVFAGRIADSGRDPEPVMKEAADLCHENGNIMSLWASCREVFNIIQAERCGVDIITVPNDILNKLKLLDKDLNEFSQETVNMFVKDGKSLGFSIV